MGEQDVLKMQQRKDFLIKFCYWEVIAVCVYCRGKQVEKGILFHPAFSGIFYDCRGIGCLAVGMALFWGKADHRISSNGL